MPKNHTDPLPEAQDIGLMLNEFLELVSRLAKQAGVTVELKPTS